MGWMLLGIIVGGMYGFVWAWMILAPDEVDEGMPADRRVRDGWRDDGR